MLPHMTRQRFLSTVLIAALGLSITGCGKKGAHDHAAHGGHVHTAPHGGALVELGEHVYNLEVVRDAAAGKLTIYVLDGHAENFIRVKPASFEASATVAGEKRSLTFKAVANSATGETVGDTSQFDAAADWLKTTSTFDVVIPSLDIRGTAYSNVALKLAK
jgi:hypothetical protein